ncbi:hypothetical protein EDB89DRAFT_1941119 [Lactarius sanguifluus]|nr:hypothetical protein EDB89DRAFT_1941119 [Lactarius sanguifluus]
MTSSHLSSSTCPSVSTSGLPPLVFVIIISPLTLLPCSRYSLCPPRLLVVVVVSLAASVSLRSLPRPLSFH